MDLFAGGVRAVNSPLPGSYVSSNVGTENNTAPKESVADNVATTRSDGLTPVDMSTHQNPDFMRLCEHIRT
jgi:hypothetical protein